jgi:hypothetical protein
VGSGSVQDNGSRDPDLELKEITTDPEPMFRIRMFLGLPDPDPLVRDTDPGGVDHPDPSNIKQKL